MHFALTQLLVRERIASRHREAELHRLGRAAAIHSRQHALARRVEVTACKASNGMGAP